MSFNQGTLRVNDHGELWLHVLYSQSVLFRRGIRGRVMRERNFPVECNGCDLDERLRLDGHEALLATALLWGPRKALRLSSDLHLLLHPHTQDQRTQQLQLRNQ
jgi:hypothetical protein